MALALTRADLITYLRMRLNDSLIGSNTSGAYTDSQLGFCIDLAYRETCVASLCHKYSKSLTLTTGTHTYDCSEVFEPVEVSLNGATLDKVEFGDMAVSLQTWNSTANGTPEKWMQITGGSIRIYPAPDASAATHALLVNGYACPTDMGTSGTPDALQDGYAISALLDRAEAEARFMRATYGQNALVGSERMKSWQAWVGRVRGSGMGEH